MGEKETAATAREASAPSISEREAGSGMASGKASGGKQVEEQRWVQDDTPDGETGLEAGKASGGKQVEEQKMQPGGGGAGAGAKAINKASPELMLRAVAGGAVDPTPAQLTDDGVDDDGDSPADERGMNSIRNMKA